MSVEHVVDVLADDTLADYGYQCLTCGEERTTYLSLAAAEEAADQHRITGQAAS